MTTSRLRPGDMAWIYPGGAVMAATLYARPLASAAFVGRLLTGELAIVVATSPSDVFPKRWALVATSAGKVGWIGEGWLWTAEETEGRG